MNTNAQASKCRGYSDRSSYEFRVVHFLLGEGLFEKASENRDCSERYSPSGWGREAGRKRSGERGQF